MPKVPGMSMAEFKKDCNSCNEVELAARRQVIDDRMEDLKAHRVGYTPLSQLSSRSFEQIHTIGQLTLVQICMIMATVCEVSYLNACTKVVHVSMWKWFLMMVDVGYNLPITVCGKDGHYSLKTLASFLKNQV
ncbi:unnamed protein product, partial [Amoebophrya sp. A25]|eukprot:GSA25T00021385001.1